FPPADTSVHAFRPCAVPPSLSVVNPASLEDYLRGLVPGEMPSSWHRHALRWRIAERARTASSGAFRVSVAQPGRYRVRADGVPGPGVRIADRTQRRVCG
ncbi:MAG TPA: SpoIID/LytB domain-containing protein, partial [Thermoleophilaceae bacterium]|nr:SpoIID/LytB domain-containing protein [Thermoleophilaceae bacterium]